MFRALSTRSHNRYERLGDDEPARWAPIFEGEKLKRVTSLPAQVFGYASGKPGTEVKLAEKPEAKHSKKKAGLIHPIFSLFDAYHKKRNKKKTTTLAKPEFARYKEYLKEGGIWDLKSNAPVIYYK